MDSQTNLEVLSPRPGAVVVECKGEHDLTTREATGRLFARLVSENDLVVIDITEAEFIDSSFVNTLLVTGRLACQSGKRFRLQVATAPMVRRVLEISGILATLEHVGTRAEALG